MIKMPALVEREEISGSMQEALRRHVIQEREKKKLEEKEAEKDFERRAKIEEERRRKEEEDSVTLEKIKEQLAALHKRQEKLKAEKHQLFSQLKKVLQEEERKKQKLKEQTELPAANHGHYQHSLSGLGGYQMMQGGHYQPHHQMQYLTVDRHSSGLPGQSSPHLHQSLRHSMSPAHVHQVSPATHQAVKRPHSPGSPQPSPIQMYQMSAQAVGHGHLPSTPQHPKYDHSFAGHSSNHLGMQSLSSTANPPSSIHGTPNRHIGVLHRSASPASRPSGTRSPYSLGKQLEIASQKSGFGDEAGGALNPPRRPIRMLSQAPPLIPQTLSSSPRPRSGSPARYPLYPEKSLSPFHTNNQMPSARYYK